jgi:hypothetical protein
MKSYAETLAEFVPPLAANVLAEWLVKYNFNLKITRTRYSKLGDYRYPLKPGERHQITINHDLNPYAFLITFVHEVAHLTTFEKYGKKVKSHGNEWKAEFRGLMRPFFELNVFPDDVAKALTRYLLDPAASSCSDIHLQKVLKKYDTKTNQSDFLVYIEDLPINSRFEYRGVSFVKGHQLRKRFKCQNLQNKHFYLFNPLVEVKPIV